MSTIYDVAPHQDQLPDLLQRSVRDLADALAEETRNYQRHQPYNDQVGLALFTLAINHQSQEAWTVLYTHYQTLVCTWVMQHPQAAPIIARLGGDSTGLINGAFVKFFQGVTPAKLQHFANLASLLKYLKTCATSVVVDEARQLQAQHLEEGIEALEDLPDREDPAERVLSHLHACNLWQLIRDELRGKEEQVLFFQIFVLGMKPGEIFQQDPDAFKSVDAIYCAKRSMLERLQRNRRLQHAAILLWGC